VTSLTLPALIGSIGLRETAGLIAAFQDGLFLLDPVTGERSLVANPESDLPENRFNDGRVDRQGRFWAGTMNDRRRDPTGALYRLDPDRRVTRIRGEVIVPNSLAWSPDSRVMYFADTYRYRIWRYDFDAEAGLPSGERVFADTSGGPGRPDGSAVDEAGCLWNAEYAGARLVRYTPAGAVDRVVPMPVSNPTCCAFGGPNLETLFVTSARQRLSPSSWSGSRWPAASSPSASASAGSRSPASSADSSPTSEARMSSAGRLTGLFPPEMIRTLELPGLPPEILQGFAALEDLTGTVSDAMDTLGIPAAVPASVLRPLLPGARLAGPALTLRNEPLALPLDQAVRSTGRRLGDIECHNLARPGDVLVVQGSRGSPAWEGSRPRSAGGKGRRARWWTARCGTSATPGSRAIPSGREA